MVLIKPRKQPSGVGLIYQTWGSVGRGHL